MDFISKMAASKMGQLKAEIAELKERLEETHTDEQRARRFFVKFWGAKVSMHSWRGHALKTVCVLFRCVF